MNHFGKAVVSSRFVILIAAVLLLIPSIIGIRGTRINYDMLVYLPDTIETMQGQDILVNEFGTGAISMLIVEGKEDKEIVRLKEQVEAVDHVKDVIWYDSFADISIPKELLPQKLLDVFVRGDATLLAVTYDTSTSADETMEAVTAIRELLDDHSFLQGTNAVVTDTKILCEEEEPVYVGLAVLLALIITGLAMDTFAAPVLFLLSIGCAILYNMGTNVFLGEISYVTKAVAAVLQLGVTMDYSIFLWHSFEENMEHTADSKEAMASAIQATLQSVVGSSITTIAGFAALCFMSFTFGLDVGVVMMKGVAFGVISCVTILPSMILVFLPLVLKTRHRPLVPKLAFLPGWVAKHYKAVLVLFVLIWIPAVIGYFRTDVYYDLDKSLPTSLPSVEARAKLQDTFDMSNTMMILADADLSPKAASDLCEELRDVDGVKGVMGIDAFLGAGIPRDMLPEELSGKLQAGGWQLLLLTSCYQAATDEMDAQISAINSILDRRDPKAMLIGDAACVKDLIVISDHDFNVVNWVSIGMIFVIILVVFRSLSLPFLLVLTIEFAIFINMAVPYYTGTPLPFVASIIIGTVQLGSTVDYAILMTSRYQTERAAGKGRDEAVRIAHSTSIPSILVSGLTFFAATFGVGIYSNIDIVSSLCTLMARGALISMAVVITVLPALLMLFDPLIVRTGIGFLPKKHRKENSGLDLQKA